MWGRTELERVHKEAELFLRAFRSEAEKLEHGVLKLCVVDSDGTASKLSAVDHYVVGRGAHLAGVGMQERYVLRIWRGERMVHGVVTLCFLVPLE